MPGNVEGGVFWLLQRPGSTTGIWQEGAQKATRSAWDTVTLRGMQSRWQILFCLPPPPRPQFQITPCPCLSQEAPLPLPQTGLANCWHSRGTERWEKREAEVTPCPIFCSPASDSSQAPYGYTSLQIGWSGEASRKSKNLNWVLK